VWLEKTATAAKPPVSRPPVAAWILLPYPAMIIAETPSLQGTCQIKKTPFENVIR
jgi:hypothetical protein